MSLNSEMQPRKKLRMAGFDYRMPGYYFVTICTNQRECLFGEISNNKIHLNAAGQMVDFAWRAISEHYSDWALDVLIVMPNHIHVVVVLAEAGPARGPAPTEATSQDSGSAQRPGSTLSLPYLIRNLKSYTMTCYRHGVRTKNWPAFHQTLWQRGYHERVIRDENSLEKIRQYILNNPLQWGIDKENPLNVS